MSDPLSRATETIERMQQEMSELQEEVSRLIIRREEGTGDIAHRLVTLCIHEAVQKVIKKTPKARYLTVTTSRDFRMTVGGTRYRVRVQEVDL